MAGKDKGWCATKSPWLCVSLSCSERDSLRDAACSCLTADDPSLPATLSCSLTRARSLSSPSLSPCFSSICRSDMSPAEQLAASQLGWDEVCNLSLCLPPSLPLPPSDTPIPCRASGRTARAPQPARFPGARSARGRERQRNCWAMMRRPGMPS